MSSSTLQRRKGSKPPEVQALPEWQQVAWQALADGLRWKDAAALSGHSIGELWALSRREPFRSLRSARVAASLDSAGDMVDKALHQGLESEDAKAQALGLRAAMHVQKVASSSDAAALAHAGGVSVNINLGSVLAASLPAPPIDIDVPDV